MNKLKNARHALSTVGALIAVCLAQLIDNDLSRGGASFWSAKVWSLVGALLTFVFFDQGAKFLINNSRWLRATILGKENIEGVWWDVVYRCCDEGRPEVVSVGILTIDITDGEYFVSGQNYNPRDIGSKPINCFHSIFIDYRRFELFYVHDRSAESNLRNQGSTRIRFFRHGKQPMRYQGYYQDEDRSSFEFFGERIVDPKEVNRLDAGIDGIREVIQAKFEKWSTIPDSQVNKPTNEDEQLREPEPPSEAY